MQLHSIVLLLMIAVSTFGHLMLPTVIGFSISHSCHHRRLRPDLRHRQQQHLSTYHVSHLSFLNSSISSSDGHDHNTNSNKTNMVSVIPNTDGTKLIQSMMISIPIYISIMMMMMMMMVTSTVVYVVSGGGLDFAGTDISGKDFSNGNYKGKDFTQGKQ
jgi:energy-coupling factor transporter transmembrane protein EcfT